MANLPFCLQSTNLYSIHHIKKHAFRVITIQSYDDIESSDSSLFEHVTVYETSQI